MLRMPADERDPTFGAGFGWAAGGSQPRVVGLRVVLGAHQSKISQFGRAAFAVRDHVMGVERPAQGPAAAGLDAISVTETDGDASGRGGQSAGGILVDERSIEHIGWPSRRSSRCAAISPRGAMILRGTCAP